MRFYHTALAAFYLVLTISGAIGRPIPGADCALYRSIWDARSDSLHIEQTIPKHGEPCSEHVLARRESEPGSSRRWPRDSRPLPLTPPQVENIAKAGKLNSIHAPVAKKAWGEVDEKPKWMDPLWDPEAKAKAKTDVAQPAAGNLDSASSH